MTPLFLLLGVTASNETPQEALQSGVKHHPDRRRKFVLPDGTVVVATWEEVAQIVREAAQPKVEPRARRKATMVSAEPARRVIAIGKVKTSRAVVAGEEVTRVELPKTYRWAPQQAWYDACLASLKLRDEEDFIVMLLLH